VVSELWRYHSFRRMSEFKEAEFPTVVAPIVYANRENIAEYGLIIDTEVPNAGLTIPFYKGAVEEGFNIPFEYEGKAVIRTARISKRASEISWLERHMGMTQLFFGIGDQPFAMVLGKPNHEEGGELPDLTTAKCFVFPPGHGLLIHKGTWHDFPLAVDKPVTCFTANSEKVVQALCEMKEMGEMNHGDVFKYNIRDRLGVQLHAYMGPETWPPPQLEASS
jgi:ureidoglycolate lyase